jgi:poly-gamma-glutamate synthesis protein (capsule biosynthesis protein)
VKAAWIGRGGVLLCAALGAACGRADAAGASGPVASASAAPEPTPEPSIERAPEPRVVLLAAGDVSFGRDLGQALLQDPEHDFFAPVTPLLAGADLRFVNLEGPLSDQKGETQSPWNLLTFTGPPGGAAALARAGIDVVSTANNHAWDYGHRALVETIDNLDRAGVHHVGTGRDPAEASAPVVLERNGIRVAFVAVTDIWNFGSLRTHVAAPFVAGADEDRLVASVRALRAERKADVVVVSYHGGVEYVDRPLPRARRILHAAVDAGADLVLGHHPHVLQGIAWRRGRPILYGLGNLLMRMSQTEKRPTGYLARITVGRDRPPAVEACPLLIHGATPRRLADEPDPHTRALEERRFARHLAAISADLGGVEVGEPGGDGCMPVRAVEGPPR